MASSNEKVRLAQTFDLSTRRELVVCTCITALAFSPDGQLLALGADNGTVHLWNPVTGEAVRDLEGPSSALRSLAFSPDGRYLAAVGDESKVAVWRLADDSLQHLEGAKSWLTTLAFTPDGRRLVAGGVDWLGAWAVVEGEPTGDGRPTTWPVGNTLVHGLAISPDGRLLVSGGDDSTVKLWRMSDSGLVHTLRGPSGSVTAVAFSPDGGYVAGGSLDHTIYLWRVSDGQPIANSSAR
jgi:WD40 repeat protein